ncbi:MAG: DUF4397 domain-containing protein [Acidobacteria bacterium]|nr:DUF4397 domain-containing protein [Acidobacteriota bacterium]
MKQSTKNMVPVLAVLLMLTIACSRESSQDRSVKTTTDSGSTTAPASRDVAKRDKALVRVVHAMPAKPPVDAFAGESKTFSNVTYKTVTPYAELPDNRHRLTLKPAGQTKPLTESSENFAGGKHYTLIAMPSSAKDPKPELKVVADHLTPPTAGKARVRVINASPDAGELDVYVMKDAEKLFGGVNFKSEAGYAEIAPTTTVVELRPQGKKEPLLMLPQFSFEPNKTYTIVIMGQAKANRLEAVTVEDQFVGAYAQQ